MELRHIRYFIAVAEELHFGRAAERLHIVQPALSKQIASLEEDIGVQLLDRNKKRVLLTNAGQAFFEEARQLLDRAEQAVETARKVSIGQVGKLAVGFIGPATYSLLPKLLSLHQERFPQVELILHEGTSVEQAQLLSDGTIQLGFVRPPVNDDTLTFQTVQEHTSIVVLPEEHPLTTLDEIPLKTLWNEPFIMVPRHREPGYYDHFVTLCHQAGFSPQVVQESQQVHTILSLVAANVGISLLGSPVENLRRPGIVCKPVQGPSTEIALLAVRRDEEPDPKLAAFLELVEEVTSM